MIHVPSSDLTQAPRGMGLDQSVSLSGSQEGRELRERSVDKMIRLANEAQGTVLSLDQGNQSAEDLT